MIVLSVLTVQLYRRHSAAAESGHAMAQVAAAQAAGESLSNMR